MVLTMNTSRSVTLAAQAPAYVSLQRQMRNALRIQHPEWILPNGESPTCDAYELRLAHVLGLSLASETRSRALSK